MKLAPLSTKRKGTGQGNSHQYTHSYWLFISYAMQTMQPTWKITALESEREKERERERLLSAASVISHDMSFFNGFSHRCVRGNMICIHLTVTATTWGRGLTERLLMCKHNMILPATITILRSFLFLVSFIAQRQTSGSISSPTTVYSAVTAFLYFNYLYVLLYVLIYSRMSCLLPPEIWKNVGN